MPREKYGGIQTTHFLKTKNNGSLLEAGSQLGVPNVSDIYIASEYTGRLLALSCFLAAAVLDL